ncbi:hypothetical protein V9L00_03515 [Pseudoxanthomonas sp. CCNWLW206]
MEAAHLYDYLLRAKARRGAWVLTFDDGDSYPLDSIDLCYSFGRDGTRENEPLQVTFDSCTRVSQKRTHAHREGYLRTTGVFWTSTDPIEPVAMEYGVENVVAVWDEDKSYLVYDLTRDSKDGLNAG